ncbi:sugar kinase [Jannaschia sp. Os4]|nr:sugar kinase [Jannaschia sp. Os4]
MVELSPDGPGRLREGFAGDTFNTAWYLARLDEPVGFVSAVGRDALSDDMLAFMAAAGVGTAHVLRRDDATVGLYRIALRDGERSFTYWRGQSAARRLADDPARLRVAFAGADVLYLSGITLGILAGAARAALLAEVARARAGGARVAFDPNLRPALWPSSDAMRAAVSEAAEVSDVVLPSHEDEATWFGDANPAATLARYRSLGAGEVVVKDGGAPVLAYVDGADLTVPCPPAEVVDSTAAGDSFNAGYLAARRAGQGAAPAIRAGAALAARVIGAKGALVD